MHTYYVAGVPYSDELYHLGIKGMKWGIRRYMNEDGTLTPAGKARYGTKENFERYLENKQRSREKIRENRQAGAISRGTKLLDKNRSVGGEIGRGIGRQVAIQAGVAGGAAAVSFLMMKGVMNASMSSLVKRGAAGVAGASALAALGIGLSAKNVYTTARNVHDIGKARDAGVLRKKDRIG